MTDTARYKRNGCRLLVGLMLIFAGQQAFAMSDEACMECHSDPEWPTTITLPPQRQLHLPI